MRLRAQSKSTAEQNCSQSRSPVHNEKRWRATAVQDAGA